MEEEKLAVKRCEAACEAIFLVQANENLRMNDSHLTPW